MIAFGPVPSRRLGRSLGINNIPPKACTYSCVYCQLGLTPKMETRLRPFYDPEKIREAVFEKMESAHQSGESIDYLTFVPDGEPTLDIHLGEEIERLRSLTDKKIAVITNSSLIWHDQVKEYLNKADWVSLKIDSVNEAIWRKINRPHRSLELQTILDGIVEFAKHYRGNLVTETMLVRGLNDNENQIRSLAKWMQRIPANVSYLSIPIRPPAEKQVQPPDEDTLIRAYEIMSAQNHTVEYLIGYEGNAFAFTGYAEKDLLSITAVHPMREEAVSELLNRAETNWSVIDQLIEKGIMVKKTFQGKTFYARKLYAPRDHDILGLRME
ncbi:radical SAM protein [bacterium]|nr:radical SAM protein [bacterium]